MDAKTATQFIESNFDSCFLNPLKDFVEIPNLTPAFDENFLTNGLIMDACRYITDFADAQNIPGLTHRLHSEEGKSPMLCIVIEGTGKRNVMFYGHVDKQPHMEDGWDEGLGATKAVVRGDKLYGRGSSDDGYAPFSALLAIKTVLAQGVPLPRIVICLECEEESGSTDLIYLLDKMKSEIQVPDICICLDAGTADYDNLWLTSSLRGVVACNVRAEVVPSGQHSGILGGIIPESLSILRAILDRIDESSTGKVVSTFQTPVPSWKAKEAKELAALKGKGLYEFCNFLDGAKPMFHDDLSEMYLGNTWYAMLSVTGANGLPPTADAGNVLRAFTEFRISLRLPPNKDSAVAARELQEIIEKDPPYGAKITVSGLNHGDGYCKAEYEPWMYDSLSKAAQSNFGSKTFGTFATGGSIPFLTELSKVYPTTMIVGLGAAGADCNCHNPNENLDLPFSKKFIGALASVLADCGTV
ncbi:hypothetical protein SARC_05766 [Sphaeroforma arctica JP610]|uniref:Uncharacterized protein n=1 Tax=Sphaeroforma arctica JP610 TaxID=667725 RepID=A0A0L0FYL3_9EUKA|nr:hypothetical protein SARC_05766 [Sphaeroforma arctica JP610]KNC81937.1 hypothetical protein SARC_05766 [Sphaeroforma arctica JP610]|eukprot:XP_014155839.1 hypothetical protein SARC_05766 [Sphaeroforma arctica JP610]